MDVDPETVSQSLVDYLETRRSAGEAETRGRFRRRRVEVPAGQAVSVADMERMSYYTIQFNMKYNNIIHLNVNLIKKV